MCIVFMCIHLYTCKLEWRSGCNSANGGYVCVLYLCVYICIYVNWNGARDVIVPMVGKYVYCIYVYTSVYM